MIGTVTGWCLVWLAMEEQITLPVILRTALALALLLPLAESTVVAAT
jgi:hypothetical protein